MSRQAICDVLNSLEVIEQQGGDDAYILVANNKTNRVKLAAVGVPLDKINLYGDGESFCILALAFGEGYASDYRDGRLFAGEPSNLDGPALFKLGTWEYLRSEGDNVWAVRPSPTTPAIIIDENEVAANLEEHVALFDAGFPPLYEQERGLMVALAAELRLNSQMNAELQRERAKEHSFGYDPGSPAGDWSPQLRSVSHDNGDLTLHIDVDVTEYLAKKYGPGIAKEFVEGTSKDGRKPIGIVNSLKEGEPQ